MMTDKTEDQIKKLIEKYAESKKIRNLSELTIKGDIRYLKKFFEYIQKEHSVTQIEKITREIIYGYQVYQYEKLNKKGKPNTVSEQNNAIKPVKHFFSFLKEYDYLAGNPTSSIAYAKEPQRLPRGILDHTQNRVLNMKRNKNLYD